MKLDPDISGVCRITGTREMITLPAIAASMKMYSATNPSPIGPAPHPACVGVPESDHNRPGGRRCDIPGPVNPTRVRAFQIASTALCHPARVAAGSVRDPCPGRPMPYAAARDP
ncbi:hypothetical protein GCM10028795_03560 [Lysobacter olei]